MTVLIADALDLYARTGWAALLIGLIALAVLGAVSVLATGPFVAPDGYDEPPSNLDRRDGVTAMPVIPTPRKDIPCSR